MRDVCKKGSSMSTILFGLTTALFAVRRSGTVLDAAPRLIAAFMALGIFCAVAWYILSKLRAGWKNEEIEPSEMMSQFSDLYDSGELTPEEYRAIKQRLAAGLADELKAKKERTLKKMGRDDSRRAELERLLRAEKK